MIYAFLGIFLLVGLADMASTLWAAKSPRIHELNPLMRALLANTSVFITVSLAVNAGIIGFLYYIHQQDRLLGILVTIAGIALRLYAVVKNLGNIRKVRKIN